MKPCAHCGEELRHVESLAQSFDPPRVYHEYHHPKNACPLALFGHWSFTDDVAQRAAFVEAWNTRVAEPYLSPAPVATNVVTAAEALIASISDDNGPGGGLTSGATQRRSDELRTAISKFKKELKT